MKQAGFMVVMAGCTPNYVNDEGAMDRLPIEAKMKLARASVWAAGMEDYRRVVEAWRNEGEMKGFRIEVAELAQLERGLGRFQMLCLR